MGTLHSSPGRVTSVCVYVCVPLMRACVLHGAVNLWLPVELLCVFKSSSLPLTPSPGEEQNKEALQDVEDENQ